MSFWTDLVDEVNDRNIDKSKIPGEKQKKTVVTEQPDFSEETVSLPEEPIAEPEAVPDDPDFPEHPDYIALKPQWTERQLWRMPAIRFYLTIIFFCLGMIAFGIVNSVFALGLQRGAVGWWQIFGGVIGFVGSREIVEPRMRIPFANGTYEQKKQATEAYLAEIKKMDEALEELAKKNK